MGRSLLRIAALLLITPLAHATGIEIGTVKFEYGQIFSTSSHPGYTFFSLLGGTRTDIPACATVPRWVINKTYPAAKLQINVLLAASLTGKRVRVQGTGDCAVWSDSETVWDVHFED